MINTHDIDDFRSSFPAGAAHAASEVDDAYDSSTPEGAAIAVLFVAACFIALVAVLIAVL